MSVAFWIEVFELRDWVDRAAGRAAHQLSSTSFEPDATSRSALLLSTLHMDLRHALERYAAKGLEAHLRGDDTERAVNRALRLVSFWLNERIRRRLPAADRADWEPVGPAGVDLRNGGRLFFLELDELLSESGEGSRGRLPSSSDHPAGTTLADLALFCLEEGFTGELAASPRKLEEYKARLRRTLPSGAPEPTIAVTLGGIPRAPRVACALGVCVLFYAACAAGFGWLGAP